MKNFEIIEAYLLGKLSKEATSNFEKRISENKELATEVALQKLELKTIETIDKNALRATMKSLRSEVKSETLTSITRENISVKPKFKYLSLLIAAASVALLIGIFYFNSLPNNHESLVHLAYQLEQPNYGNIRSGDASKFEESFLSILINNNQTRAIEAIPYFQSFSDSSNPLFPQAKLNLAHAYFLSKDYQNAIAIFSQITLNDTLDSRWRQTAEFYLAISYLAYDNELKAKKILNLIANDSSHRYNSSAMKINDRLSK